MNTKWWSKLFGGSSKHVVLNLTSTSVTPAKPVQSETSMHSSPQAKQVRRILNELMSSPTTQLIDRFTAAVTDSKDAAVTDILLSTLNNPNPGFRGIAIQCLGLVYDPRALGAAFKAYQTTKDVFDHQQRAALSIINLVANGRDTNPVAITYLMTIFDDNAMPASVKAHAVRALRQFRTNDAQVEEFFLKLNDHPSQEIRFAAQ